MRKLLLISADQAKLGAAPGAHTWKSEHEVKFKKAVGKKLEFVVATPEEAKKHYDDAEIVAAFPIRMPDVSLLPQAKWLHSFSAGVDKILTPAVATSKIHLTNSSGVHATPIAEMNIAYMLIFARGFTRTIGEQPKHEWKKNYQTTELRESTVLVVGLGAIGLETARLAHAFGAHVHAIARSKKTKPKFIEKLGTSKDLDKFLSRADYVVITLPHTKETHYLFDKKKFGQMRESAVIINIGRGGIIKESDLIDALKAEKIAGAALDVFEQEPLPKESALWDMPNVIITPHHSGLSMRYIDRAVDLLCDNLKAYFAGKKLPNEVDKKLGY